MNITWSFAVVALPLQCMLLVCVVAQQHKGGLCSLFVQPQANYFCSEYTVTTDDGFILGVQRMGSGKELSKEPKKPVFLMHGILSGGDTWVLNSPDESLGFILADAGYDVWIGNNRVTDYSHGHVIYKPDDKEYWDWSVDELAFKDLVVMLKLAYKTTNQRMHYIGFSQGTQAAFAALSEGMLMEYMDKLVMIAPIAYVQHATSIVGVIGVRLHIDSLFNRLKFYSFTTKTKAGKQYVQFICGSRGICFDGWVAAFTGINCCINNTRIPFYDKYETQVTSVKNLQHLAQGYRHGTFAKYDYGSAENMKRYNSVEPPNYDVSKIPTDKMLLVYGKRDALSDVGDVTDLLNKLPKGYQSKYVDNYAHLDFLVGYNANVVVYKDVMDFLKK